MRSLGLLVDGPAVWGRPIASRSGGVFVVELPGGASEAPLDMAAIGRWLERVPGLLLDGERPTAHTLAQRLAAFWLPGEPILYVGRAARSLGARIAALYATPLGDSRPHPGGHWLAALSVRPRLRIWWAETDAQEEYEDALLAAVAGRQPAPTLDALPDASVVLPFANLLAATGESKRHGLENSLRAPDAPSAGPGPRAVTQPAACRRPPAERRTATRRTRSASTSTAPAPAPTYLSRAGVEDLAAELEHLRTEVRPGVIDRVKTARELGDLRENSEYESARREQSFVEGRIQALEALIRSAVVVEPDATRDVVGVGSTVVVELDGTELTWVIVGSSEADPASGRISYAAPVGQALLGRRAGEEAIAQLPRGTVRLRVLEVR